MLLEVLSECIGHDLTNYLQKWLWGEIFFEHASSHTSSLFVENLFSTIPSLSFASKIFLIREKNFQRLFFLKIDTDPIWECFSLSFMNIDEKWLNFFLVGTILKILLQDSVHACSRDTEFSNQFSNRDSHWHLPDFFTFCMAQGAQRMGGRPNEHARSIEPVTSIILHRLLIVPSISLHLNREIFWLVRHNTIL